MEAKILRRPENENGVFGKLVIDNKPYCVTLERPSQDPDHPCIPAGIYHCKLYNSPVHGTIFQVMDVPGRSNIEIHPFNLFEQSLGCIGLGTNTGIVTVKLHDGTVKTHLGIINSKATVEKFMAEAELDMVEEFDLTIEWA